MACKYRADLQPGLFPRYTINSLFFFLHVILHNTTKIPHTLTEITTTFDETHRHTFFALCIGYRLILTCHPYTSLFFGKNGHTHTHHSFPCLFYHCMAIPATSSSTDFFFLGGRGILLDLRPERERNPREAISDVNFFRFRSKCLKGRFFFGGGWGSFILSGFQVWKNWEGRIKWGAF